MATIRHVISDRDAVMEAFAHVCATLAADDLARLRVFEKRQLHTAKFSSWLVVVVRNQTIDWVRKQQGRRRVRIPDGLNEVEREIFQLVFVHGDSHREAYERMHSGSHPELSFSQFLKALRRVYHARGARATKPLPYEDSAAGSLVDDAPLIDQVLEADELRVSINEALELLQPEERLAVQLFVIDEVRAAEVARLLGWPNAKSVYNRVYRALAGVRQRLERADTQGADTQAG
jgi:RNA polymerase sigma factor (sigma-70 family)